MHHGLFTINRKEKFNLSHCLASDSQLYKACPGGVGCLSPVLSGSIQSISAAIPHKFDPSLDIPASTNSLAWKRTHVTKGWRIQPLLLTSGRMSKILWRAGSVTSKLPPVGGDALNSSVIPSPFHLLKSTIFVLNMRTLLHYLWTDFNSSSETPINCRNLTVPRPVLNCSNWGSFKKFRGQKQSHQPYYFWIYLCHQQMSQCAGPPIKRFRPVDVIPCHQLVFRLEDIPLGIHINKNIFMTLWYVLLCYWVEQSGRPGWRLILIWLSSQSTNWHLKKMSRRYHRCWAPECELKTISRSSLWTGGRWMNPGISVQVRQPAWDIMPMGGRIGSAWVS